MTIPFFRDGFALPVAQALLALLNQEVANTGLDQERLTQLTFNFRSPGYSAETGGVHPVELRLIRGLHGWVFDYITDFSYQGLGQDAELCKELDFNLSCDEHYLQGWGPLPGVEAQELFALWQSNFISYAQLGYFTVTVSGD
ncbi:DUF2787 family protein [Aeromonas sp. HMWF014]|uniref:DUF2787 family protein n=1 Tax=Aeromonas sp. HMWF014 TaxID=2056850 RepID=UPI000D39D3D9|nr:DUF2787 family protein [Aeromonas sp. HMWF014]PTT46050.1 DUF2787 domain-containing protein [Aeromonas sp. HMWF014]